MATFKHVPLLVQKSLGQMANRITIARRARGLTQTDLAKLAGVGLSTIVSLEGGHDGVSLGNFLKVLDAMSLLEQFDRVPDLRQDDQLLSHAERDLGRSP